MYRFVDKVLCSTHDEGELRERIRARYRPHGDAALSEIALVISATKMVRIKLHTRRTPSAQPTAAQGSSCGWSSRQAVGRQRPPSALPATLLGSRSLN